jgi:hypothetical protein
VVNVLPSRHNRAFFQSVIEKALGDFVIFANCESGPETEIENSRRPGTVRIERRFAAGHNVATRQTSTPYPQL